MMPETANPWDELVEPPARLPRSLETREQSERARTWSEPSTLPNLPARDGYVHKWVRTDLRGVPDKPTYAKRLREGWEPIELKDYPELQVFAHDGQITGKLEVGGLIACRMPSEMVKQRNEYYRNKSREQETSAEEHYMRDNNELVKKIAANSRRIVFGQNVR